MARVINSIIYIYFFIRSISVLVLRKCFVYRAIPFFKKLLESDNESTVKGATQALALIFEQGCLEKFEGDTSAMEEINVEKIVEVKFPSF